MNSVVFNDSDSISGGGKQRRRSHGMKDTVSNYSENESLHSLA
jgi:hypothetical protein